MESSSALAEREHPSKPIVPILRGGLRASQSQMANEYSREQSIAERPSRLALDAVIFSFVFLYILLFPDYIIILKPVKIHF